MTISTVTTCMGRLDHLQSTLPHLVKQLFETIVVDYSCPQHTKDWVSNNFPSVKVVSVEGRTSFDLAKARNVGVPATTGEWLCFIDADVTVVPEFGGVVTKLLRPGHFYRDSRRNKPGYNGFVICARRDFDLVGGYDERCVDYGWEDSEFYENLIYRGVIESFIPDNLISAINHNDIIRTVNCIEKDKRKSWTRNCDLPKRYKS